MRSSRLVFSLDDWIQGWIAIESSLTVGRWRSATRHCVRFAPYSFSRIRCGARARGPWHRVSRRDYSARPNASEYPLTVPTGRALRLLYRPRIHPHSSRRLARMRVAVDGGFRTWSGEI